MVSPVSILIADDEASFLHSTAELLRGDGYDCEAVGDAYQAIELLQATDFDLLIVDIKMPGNRNLRLVREAQRLAPGIPIILITGYPSMDTAISAIQLPVVAYLRKPVPYRELLPHVEAALQRSKGFRAMCEVHELLETCLKKVERLRHQRLPAEKTGEGTPADAPRITARILGYCAFQLLSLQAEANSREIALTLCDQLQCPQWPVYRDALREAVEVLRETKNRFKSKELADLRDALEALLKKSGGFPHRP